MANGSQQRTTGRNPSGRFLVAGIPVAGNLACYITGSFLSASLIISSGYS
jgi:hypothetical protein